MASMQEYMMATFPVTKEGLSHFLNGEKVAFLVRLSGIRGG